MKGKEKDPCQRACWKNKRKDGLVQVHAKEKNNGYTIVHEKKKEKERNKGNKR